jgi:kynurenine formamidase
MRDLPDAPFAGWTPPDYTVDTDGKVVGAQPGTPNNWGRFGADDQIGTANLCTAERVAAAARLVRTGKRFSLGLPIGRPTPGGYRAEPLHMYRFAAGDGVLGGGLGGNRGGHSFQTSDDYVVMALQASTQVDGFGHVGGDHTLYNGYWAGLVTAASGARRLGMHKLAAQGIVGRCVLIDVARHLGVERLDSGFAIGADELDAAAGAQGTTVEPGDVVLVRTGQIGWKSQQRPGSPEANTRDEPGMSVRAIPWLADHDVAMIGIDNAACEVVPNEPDAPFLTFHVKALRDLGLYLGELFDLDELADDCANDGTYEAMFVASPMPVVGASGSPINPIVIK